MTALVSREIQMIGRERFIELNAIRVKSILLLVSGTTVKARYFRFTKMWELIQKLE
ncbi:MULTISPECIES: hypothetical protein [Leptospira]|nr:MULTISPECIES: hypothetical protein [Leptospira]